MTQGNELKKKRDAMNGVSTGYSPITYATGQLSKCVYRRHAWRLYDIVLSATNFYLFWRFIISAGSVAF